MSGHGPVVHLGDRGSESSRRTENGASDPLLLALARYVQALDERYPEGPDQLRSEGLDARANMPTVMPTRGSAK